MGTGVFVFAAPDPQGFFRDSEFIRDPGDRPVGCVGIGLGMEDEFYSALLELVGVLNGLFAFRSA